MRISDWSADVCSSDLAGLAAPSRRFIGPLPARPTLLSGIDKAAGRRRGKAILLSGAMMMVIRIMPMALRAAAMLMLAGAAMPAAAADQAAGGDKSAARGQRIVLAVGAVDRGTAKRPCTGGEGEW